MNVTLIAYPTFEQKGKMSEIFQYYRYSYNSMLKCKRENRKMSYDNLIEAIDIKKESTAQFLNDIDHRWIEGACSKLLSDCTRYKNGKPPYLGRNCQYCKIKCKGYDLKYINMVELPDIGELETQKNIPIHNILDYISIKKSTGGIYFVTLHMHRQNIATRHKIKKEKYKQSIDIIK